MDSNKIFRKLLLFAGMFGIPVFFIFFFTLGEPSYYEIPYFGEHKLMTRKENGMSKVDTVDYYRIPEFSLTDRDGNEVSKKDFEGKFIIANFLFPDCPHDCPLSFKTFKFLLYNDMVTNDDFDDVRILSHFIGDSSDREEMIEFIDHHNPDPESWLITYGDHNSIFDVDLGNGNLWRTMDSIQNHDRAAYGVSLIIDKKGHIRGQYVTSLDPEIRRITKELSLLKREEKLGK